MRPAGGGYLLILLNLGYLWGELPCGTKLLRALIFGIFAIFPIESAKQKIITNTVSRYNLVQSKYSLS